MTPISRITSITLSPKSTAAKPTPIIWHCVALSAIYTKAPIWLLSHPPVVWPHYSTRAANAGAPISASTVAKLRAAHRCRRSHCPLARHQQSLARRNPRNAGATQTLPALINEKVRVRARWCHHAVFRRLNGAKQVIVESRRGAETDFSMLDPSRRRPATPTRAKTSCRAAPFAREYSHPLLRWRPRGMATTSPVFSVTTQA